MGNIYRREVNVFNGSCRATKTRVVYLLYFLRS